MRLVALLLSSVALLAVLQAAFGLYGVLAHFVNRRTAEIGVRLVLGATSRDVVRLLCCSRCSRWCSRRVPPPAPAVRAARMAPAVAVRAE